MKLPDIHEGLNESQKSRNGGGDSAIDSHRSGSFQMVPFASPLQLQHNAQHNAYYPQSHRKSQQQQRSKEEPPKNKGARNSVEMPSLVKPTLPAIKQVKQTLEISLNDRNPVDLSLGGSSITNKRVHRQGPQSLVIQPGTKNTSLWTQLSAEA